MLWTQDYRQRESQRIDSRWVRVLGTLIAMVIGPAATADEEARLADAAQSRNIAQVQTLIRQGARLGAAQVDGMTALHWATYHDDLEMTRQLLSAGAEVAVANRYGVTPLSLACTNGRAEIVRLLLEAGADPNSQLRGGETALMTAARTGKLEPVQLLLARGAEINRKERKGQTALMWAAADGHVAVVQELIKAGADFQTPLESGFTPLLFAVREGQTEVVQALLSAGADVDSVMNPKRTGGKNPRRGMSPLLLAVENGHLELAIALVDAGADPNDQRSGFTPLHTITWVRKPNRGDSADGDPAPMGSGNLTSLQFVRALVERGAEVNARLKRGSAGRGRLNPKGATPFLLAAKTGDLPLMKLLLELGADPRIANQDGCTPLMVAAGLGTYAPGEEAGTEEEALEAVELLLALGADIDAVDRNGETAMHGAAYKSLPRVVERLASRGADVDVWYRKNKHGWTPVLIAEGHRPGNFKPSPATLKALHQQLIAHGIQPPPPTPREKRKGYQ